MIKTPHWGAIHTEPSGKVELSPASFRQQLDLAFKRGVDAAHAQQRGASFALLAELAECNACDPNRNRSNAGVWTTVNVPTALWKRVLAAAQAQEGMAHG